ncbi:MAG: N-6 DNA methylase [Bacteroidales bacterium]|nr:N-6 DNA methylase [Bacteroidales bacterium]
MASTNTQKQAAKAFVREWSGKGYEKGETQRFWLSLLHTVFGIDNPMKLMEFEVPVKTITKEKGADFIDAYISSTKVLIEQKGSHVDLSAKYRQSDGQELTPYQQARRYATGLPVSMAPRWIVACNFQTFEVHDMERPNDAPEIIQLADLEKEYHRLSFLVDDTHVHLKKELEVSIQAGEIVGVLYDKILSQYRNPEDPESQKALNKLCVRLVFCLYAEDAGIFGNKNMFHDYLEQFSAGEFREKLIKLFRILDQKPEDRDPYEDEKLLAFPYVNGGMFSGDIEVPRIDDEIRSLILERASDDFDWSLISPTIFGAVFESTLNPETRRAGGMHYTSIENIHKVIDPLFLDDLKAELADIKATSVAKTRKDKAYAFQDKISKLKFFDPACGSGNFLTESYTSLRRLENDALRIIYGTDRVIGEMADPIKVSINQFYGIEINDFACSVAQTALWIAESQMMQETDEIVGFNLEPLPLKTYTNIHEGNALRMDWNEVVPAGELNYIMGNPPFVGFTYMSSEQKDDVEGIYPGIKNVDYVSCWFKKACDYTRNTNVECAFVSTNSITQGETVGRMWERLDVSIIFAWPTFRWDSEANDKAHVHCVIVGFSHKGRSKKYIYGEGGSQSCDNINAYLADAPSVIVLGRGKPICSVPSMIYGNKPADGGHLIFTKEEKDAFLRKEPKARKWMHTLIGGMELINNKPLLDDKLRYTLWLDGISPSELRSMPSVMDHVSACKEARLGSPAAAIRKFAETPHLFAQRTQPNIPRLNDEGEPIYPEGIISYNLLVPRVSSERRKYVPMGYIAKHIVTNDQVQIIPDVSLYHFGVLTSLVHMAWMRQICGRLKSDYRYSKDVVYNNFPWPKNPSEKIIESIEQCAQAILDARALYPESSLADLYDELAMPIELRKAHHANDAAVLEAYGFPKDATESDIVARLFKMYQELTKKT